MHKKSDFSFESVLLSMLVSSNAIKINLASAEESSVGLELKKIKFPSLEL